MKDRTLVLGLGNDLLGDDGVGLTVARVVESRHQQRDVDVVESGEAGLALLEIIDGYRRVVIVDAIQTGQVEAGTVMIYGPEDFRRVVAPSAHYSGLPEVLELGARIGCDMPRDLKVVAIEIADPLHFSTELTEKVAHAIEEAVSKVLGLLGEPALQAR